MKKILEYKLKIIARLVLKKYKPDIIGVTGSVGKTGTKEAIYSVMKKSHRTRRSRKNYNNEIGVPLTILGVDSPGRSLIGWFRVFFIGLKLLVSRDKEYPQILILEMGVDRPGDMKYLTAIAKPKIAVSTLVGPSHLKYFKSIDQIRQEKGVLVQTLKKDGYAIVYYDDEQSRRMEELSTVKTLTYGFHEKAKVRASDLKFSFDDTREIKNLAGMHFKLIYDGNAVPVRLPDVIGYQSVYSALAAAAVGIAYSMNLIHISKALEDLHAPKGRMNLVDGIKDTMIIDDTYNSSPQSCGSALKLMKQINVKESARKYTVLGDMLELGKYTEDGHREVGRLVFESKADKLIAVGERARDIARGAETAGMKRDNIFRFPTAEEAARFIKDRLRPGDMVLVKGSQGMRMEKVVKEIMLQPENAKHVLVRHDAGWVGK